MGIDRLRAAVVEAAVDTPVKSLHRLGAKFPVSVKEKLPHSGLTFLAPDGKVSTRGVLVR